MVNIAFSRTKLVPPFRLLRTAVPRENSQDHHVNASRIVTMDAPAGYGKTTRVLQILQNRETDIAWISIDSSLGDLNGFWTAVLHVLQPAIADGHEELAVRFATAGDHPENAVISLCNVLAEKTSELDLILDDFHNASRDLSDTLLVFLDNIPETIRVWILSRQPVSIPLAPFALRGELLELGRGYLMFTRDECASVLRNSNSDIHDEDVDVIWDRTRGWPAGVQLMSRIGHKLRLAATGNSSLAPQLVGEILNILTHDEKSFVLKTSILPTLTAEDASELLQDSDSSECGKVLQNLERRGFFIASVESVPGAYEFIPFFRDLLAAYRLNQSEIYGDVFDRAVALLEARGGFETALAVARDAGDLDRQAGILARNAEAWFSTGRYAAFARLGRELSSLTIRNQDPLAAQLIWARTVSLQECSPEELQAQAGESEISTGLRSASRGYNIFYKSGQFDSSVKALSEANVLSARGYPSIGAITGFLQIVARRWHGDCETAYRFLSSSDRDQTYEMSPYLGILLDLNLGNLLTDLCRAPEAVAIYNDARGRLQTAFGTEDFPFWGPIALQSVLAESWAGQDPSASRRMARGILLAEDHGIDELIFLSHLNAARIVASDDVQAAYGHIDTALAHTGSSRWGRRIVLSYAVRLAAVFGTVSEARQWHAQMRAVETSADLGIVDPLLADCWALWKSGDTDRGRVVVKTLLGDQRTSPFQRLEAEIVGLRLQPDSTQAERRKIKEKCDSLNLGRWAHLHLEGSDGREVGNVSVRSEGAPPEQVPQLDDEAIRAIRDQSLDVEINGFPETFQAREIQILHLMARGLSNAEIGNIIYISVNTVRWYARQIYAKLQVRRRGEAVQAAWQNGLIGSIAGLMESS